MSAAWYLPQGQATLEAQLHKILPNHHIHRNTRREGSVKNSISGQFLEVDVWIPELHLCFEFQDYYHYKHAWYCQMPLDYVRLKDDMKRIKLMNNLQTLIAVPCWWDGSTASLQATMQFHRPDLQLVGKHEQIPCNPPLNFFEEHQQLMQAALPDSNIMEQGAWWVGEKWDGIRFFWNFAEKVLYSRHNIKIGIRVPVGDLLDNLVLDGELWSGRGTFYESQAILHSPQRFNSSFIRLVCFDDAALSTQYQPFEKRYALVLASLHKEHPAAIIAPRFLCDNEAILQETLHCITKGGGEGLMMRKPHSRYLPGRSDSLFKIKSSHTDQEALVVAVESDGALLLQLPSGESFYVAKENCMVHMHPIKGDIVSFKVEFSKRSWYYPQKMTSQDALLDYPLSQPVVYRIRSDVSWEDVIRNVSPLPARKLGLAPREVAMDAKEAVLERTTIHEPMIEVPLVDTPPNYYQNPGAVGRSWRWTSARRAYFDKFAATKGIDPLNPDSWYPVTTYELIKFDEGYKQIAQYHGGTLPLTLLQLYPDIGLQMNHFRDKQSWRFERARRTYFNNFAASKTKDPRNPSFWYGVTKKDLAIFNKVHQGTYKYQGGPLSSILTQVYPDIGIQQQHFYGKNQVWKHETARAYCDKFAESKGMDPLSPSFWYGVTAQELTKFDKGYFYIARDFGGKLSSVLLQLYPNIGLQKKLFKAPKSWKLASSRRTYFDKFAESKGADPLNPDFWHSVTPREIMSYDKGFKSISRKYGGKLSTVLMGLYPNIGLKQNLFTGNNQSWIPESSRKTFFDNFAFAKGQDPLNAKFWHNVTPGELRKYDESFRSIYRNYGGDLHTILSNLYPDIGIQQHHA